MLREAIVEHLDGESNVGTETSHVGGFGRLRCRGGFGGEEVHVGCEGRKQLGIGAMVLLVLFHDRNEEFEEQRHVITQADTGTSQIKMSTVPATKQTSIPLVQGKFNDAIAMGITCLPQEAKARPRIFYA